MSQKLLHEAYQKAFIMDRILLLGQIQKKQQDKIRLAIHFNTRSQNFNKVLYQYKGLLLMARKGATKPEAIEVTYSKSANYRDPLMKGTFQNIPPKRDTNLGGDQDVRLVNTYKTQL